MNFVNQVCTWKYYCPTSKIIKTFNEKYKLLIIIIQMWVKNITYIIQMERYESIK